MADEKSENQKANSEKAGQYDWNLSSTFQSSDFCVLKQSSLHALCLLYFERTKNKETKIYIHKNGFLSRESIISISQLIEELTNS